MAKRFSIELKSTAAESPCSNKQCKRIVSLIKDLVMKLKEMEGKWNVCLY